MIGHSVCNQVKKQKVALDRVEHWRFVVVGHLTVLGAALDDLATLAVHLEQFGHVELGLFEHLHLANVHLVEGVGGGSSLCDVSGDRVGSSFDTMPRMSEFVT